jgi:rhodanese-related sulfurtransferase
MFTLIPALLRGADPRDLEVLKVFIRRAYPSVPQLGTETLADWLQSARASVLLIDVRSTEEFEVSHLAGAVNLHTASRIVEEVRTQNPSRTVLYCSVGFRSSRMAHILAKHGVIGAPLNLEGSIFQWANEGRSLFQRDVLVPRVHPYGRRWAGLLKKGLASDC